MNSPKTTLTHHDTQAIAAAMAELLARRDESSSQLEAEANKWDNAKKLGGAVLFFASLIGGGAVTFKELQDKPTKDEVQAEIQHHVAPVAEKASEIDEVRDDVQDIKKTVKRQGDVLDYSLQNAAWQGEVLDHIAQKKRGLPDPKPEALRAKERKLMSSAEGPG